MGESIFDKPITLKQVLRRPFPGNTYTPHQEEVTRPKSFSDGQTVLPRRIFIKIEPELSYLVMDSRCRSILTAYYRANHS